MGRVKLVVAVVAVVALGATAALAATAFDDVVEGSFYDDATAWAKDEGLTVGCNSPGGGVAGTEFCPNSVVTRAQNITFTYRHQTLVIDPLLDDIRDDVTAALVAAQAAQATADDDADTLGELSCGAGQVAIDDGGWRCAEMVADWSFVTAVNRSVGSIGGGSTGIAVSSDGHPVLAYTTDIFGDPGLSLHVCGSVTCLSGSNKTLLASGNVGHAPSVAFGASGAPLVAHQDRSTGDLELYACANAGCSSGTNRGGLANGGEHPAMLIGADGKPLIVHADDGSLKLFVCGNSNCSSGGSSRTLVSGLSDITDIAVAMGDDGNPFVAFGADDVASGFVNSLRRYVCANPTCSSGSVGEVYAPLGPVGIEVSVAIGSDGNPVIAHRTGNGLGLYVCSNPSCSTGSNRDLLSGDYFSPAVVIGWGGVPYIAHREGLAGIDLEIFVCANVSCTSGQNERLVTPETRGYGLSMVRGADGTPLIAHFNGDEGDLELAQVKFAITNVRFD